MHIQTSISLGTANLIQNILKLTFEEKSKKLCGQKWISKFYARAKLQGFTVSSPFDS
jgi:hypothetical protein